MPKPMHFKGSKPYNIIVNDADNSASIDMYGEVVQSHPVDWWTGEKEPGNYIALDEFLQDLEELKTKDSITIHINSVGGDFYAGLSIYNRLRNLPASITTIVDGLAASAGSIIFMAGDKGKRKLHAGSNLMVHGVLSFFWGYYNAVELESEIKKLESHNKAAIAAYVEATGLSEDVVKEALSKDTYMTGQEAVDAGWADAVVSDDEGAPPANVMLSPNRAAMMVNGYRLAARSFGNIPANIPAMSEEDWAAVSAPANCAKPAPQVSNKNSNTGGMNMEIKNLEELRAAYPEFVAQAEAQAEANGRNAERARIEGIEAIACAIGDEKMVHDAKYGEKPMNAEQLAFAAMKAQAAIGATVLNKLEGDNKNSGAAGVVATPATAGESAMTDDEKAEAMLVGAVKNMKEVK